MTAVTNDELPESWAESPLSTLVVDPIQRVPANSEEIVYIDIGSVDRVTKTITQPQTMLGKDAPSRARKIINSGDVLVSTVRPNLNAVALVDQRYDGQFASTGFDVLRSSVLDPRWVFFSVRTPAFVERMTELVQGALYPAVRSKDVRAFSIPIAPLAEQKRIADKLELVLKRVEACRDHLDRVPALLKRFRQSVVAAATSGQLTAQWREDTGDELESDAQTQIDRFIDARRNASKPRVKFKEPVSPDMAHWRTEIPATWAVASVSAFAECLDSIRVPVKRDKRSNAHGLYPYYGANGEVDRVDDYLFDDELVLVTEDETFYGREKPIAYRSSGKCWVNNHAHVLRAEDKDACDYLCYSLMFYDVIPWLTGTTGRAKLTQAVLNALPMAVPPKVELREIVRRVRALFAIADRIEARLTSLQKAVDRLTPALLAKAFRGELVPQDPNDEPASALLERLKTAPSAEGSTPSKQARRRSAKPSPPATKPLSRRRDH